MRSFFVYVRLPIFSDSWDKHKQGTPFEGAKRRANGRESLTSNRAK